MYPRYYINNRLVKQSEYVHASLMAEGKFKVVHDEYRYFLYIGD